MHFPDDQGEAVFDVEIGRLAGVGTEILNGWVVDKIKAEERDVTKRSGGHVRYRLMLHVDDRTAQRPSSRGPVSRVRPHLRTGGRRGRRPTRGLLV